jgi:hypothetical protein
MKKLVALVAMVSLLGANVTVLAAEEPQLYYDENGEECYTTVEITEEEEAEETEYEEDNDGFLYFKDCGCAVYEDEEVFCPECDPDYIEESEEDIETDEELLEMPSDEEDETFLYEKPCGCMVYTDIETFCDECDPEYEEDVEESSDDFEEVEEHVEENVKYVEEVDVVEVAANTKGYENEQKLFENSFGKEN